ncbi:MAG: hypothetical protein GOV00_01790 [Candidatus Altiarchaeota archaeon]|nr:hypothetical protein [Candidatus Altiarchaeota archaeon]
MIIEKGFIAEGTTCESCTKIIERQARQIKGVKEVSFDYATEMGQVTFDDKKTDIDKILSKIEEKNYTCFILDESGEQESSKNFGWIFAVAGILIAAYFLFGFVEGIQLPTISQNMGYGLLFVVGLLTGFHCISMCGGFVISYTTKNAQDGKKSHKSHLMYGVGKTISYTVIGAAFGLLGSIIAFTPMMRGTVGLLAGLFLIVFGLKMLNVVPALRKFQLRTPKFLLRFVGAKSRESSSPLVIGLLNGLMLACGPLQAIYIMAAGTGSLFEGAKLLLAFGLGTLPAMIGFGYFASMISARATQKILKASGALVIVMGLFMMNNGLVLTGTGFDVGSLLTLAQAANTGGMASAASGTGIVLKDGYQEINMKVTRYGWEPNKFVLKTGVPVKWNIYGEEINGCNNAIQVPKLNLNFDVQRGEQTIEFTPTKEGLITFSCWMGMIPGTFIVKDTIDVNNIGDVQKELDSVVVPKGSGCGGGGTGGCGCGG